MTDQAPDMKAVMATLAAMQAKMDSNEEQHKAELKALKDEMPESIKTPEEMASRVVEHNNIMKELVEAQKDRLCVAFNYGIEEGDQPEYGKRSHETYRDVMCQLMWSLAGGAKRQYMYNRFKSDTAYLRLNQVMMKHGHDTRIASDGIIDVVGEEGMEMDRELAQAESSFEYFTTTMNAYEIIIHAARGVWDEAMKEKETEFLEINIGNPDVFFNWGKEPDSNIEEADYTLYLDRQARGYEADSIRKGKTAIEASRLLRLTTLCDMSKPKPPTE
jgi:hypothetical protein